MSLQLTLLLLLYFYYDAINTININTTPTSTLLPASRAGEESTAVQSVITISKFKMRDSYHMSHSSPLPPGQFVPDPSFNIKDRFVLLTPLGLQFRVGDKILRI